MLEDLRGQRDSARAVTRRLSYGSVSDFRGCDRDRREDDDHSSGERQSPRAWIRRDECHRENDDEQRRVARL